MERSFNGKRFPTFSLDTEDTIRARYAASLDTLPRYMVFEEWDEKLKDEKVINLLPVIKNFNGPVSNLFNLTSPSLDNMTALKTWLAYREITEFVLLDIDDQVKDENNENVATNFYQREKDSFKTKLENEIRSNKHRANKHEALMIEFMKVDEGYEHTKFEVEKITFSIKIPRKSRSLQDMFNELVLNTRTPFATISPFYKIFKGVVPKPDWKLSSPDFIIFKTTEKRDISDNVEYGDTPMYILDDDKFQLELSISTTPKDLNLREFLTEFLSLFKTRPQVEHEEIQKLVGAFYIPHAEIHKDVLADLIMNNQLFSSLLSVDEKEQASTDKTSIYVHFKHPTTGLIKANITPQFMDKNNPNMKGTDPRLFPLGKPYVRVRISHASSADSIEMFAEILSKLLKLYDENFDEIVNFYRKYIPKFAEKEKKGPVNVRLSNKDQAPDLFVSNYTTYCPNPPIIINDNESDDFRAKDIEVNIFPKNGAYGEQRSYVCPNSTHFGLRVNELSNKNLYPLIPCCYTSSQKVPHSLYQQYYHDEEPRTRIKTAKKVITTNKFVETQFGLLPESVRPVFFVSELETNLKILRHGVPKSSSSFLDCVRKAFDQLETPWAADNSSSFRKKLATDSKAALCKQENYDLSIEEIKNLIKSDEYFDPKRFIRLLEKEFDVNIYLFTTKSAQDKTGQEGLILPRHIQSYYKNETGAERESIFIFEHWGNLVSNAMYPQCELIVADDTFGEVTAERRHVGRRRSKMRFAYDSIESRTVRELYSKIGKFYTLAGLNTDSRLVHHLLEKGVEILSQQIDSFGKTRGFTIEFDKKKVTIFTSPLQPIDVIENDEIFALDAEDVLKLMAHLEIKGESQTLANNKVAELSGKLRGEDITIPVSGDFPVIQGYRVRERFGLSRPRKDEASAISVFTRNKKLAQCLTELMLYKFSQFLDTEKIANPDQASERINKFFKSNVTVDPSFSYDAVKVSKFFDGLKGFMKGTKLALTSKEMRKRLFYTLTLELTRNASKIIGYKNRSFIENYYTESTDFDHYSTQVILEDKESIDEWVARNGTAFAMRDGPLLDQTSEPYFISNPLVENGQVFLAQNATSLGTAIAIAETWEKDGYNLGKQAFAHAIKPFSLFSYTRSDQIVLHQFGKSNVLAPLKGRASGLKIMGYKVNGNARYTVLMR